MIYMSEWDINQHDYLPNKAPEGAELIVTFLNDLRQVLRNPVYHASYQYK